MQARLWSHDYQKSDVLNPLSCLAKKRYESHMSMCNKVLED